MSRASAAEWVSDADLREMRHHASQAAQLLKALANENRLMVLCALAEGEQAVGQINERVDLSQSALSQHLAILRREGIVQTRRESQTIYYSLASTAAAGLIHYLYETFCSR